MTHSVTARKWRPKNFSAMVGQQHVLQALVNALNQNRLHHAYLFTGTRGVGKTTLARILAKCLNCEQGVSADPCGTCSNCTAIDQGCFVDLIEVDAASRTKVEDTRELLDNVQYLPTQGRFKIYLIDEVHMLSGHSFNALLKTLEEPPEHVKFLLATTDPQKLPVTVLSRCLQFHLKHLDEAQIGEQLSHILSSENIAFEEAALAQLAIAANGSMRDALSLLDQAIAHGGGEVKAEPVRAMLGTLNPQTITQLLQALGEHSGEGLLKVVDDIAMDTGDFEGAIVALIQALHDIAMLQTLPEIPDMSRYQSVQPFASVFLPETVQLLYQIALHGRRDMQWAPSPRAGFEMTCMRLLAFYPDDADNRKVVVKAQAAAPKAPAPKPVPKQATPAPTPVTSEPEVVEDDFEVALDVHPKMEPPPAPVKTSTPVNGLPKSWDAIISDLQLKGMAATLASHCVVHDFNGHMLVCHLSPKHAPLFNKTVSDRIQTALGEYLKQDIKLEIKLLEVEAETPAQKQAAQDEAVFQANKSQIESDPVVQGLVDTFDAKIDDGSISSK